MADTCVESAEQARRSSARRKPGILSVVASGVIALVVAAATPGNSAEIPFKKVQLFFEYNATAGDGGVSMTIDLSPSTTSLKVPPEFLQAGTEYKFEVLAIAANLNRTITEGTFVTP